MTTSVSIKQSTDDVALTVLDWSFDEPGLRADEMPRFSFKSPLKGGVTAHILAAGKEVEYRRNGELVFTGLITQSTPQGGDPDIVEVRGIHKGYHRLRRYQCDDYDFDEDGDPSTVRDGVTVNPWEFFIFREPDSTLDVYGNGYPVHGWPLEDGVRALCGTRFLYQHDFQDNTHLLASDVYATTNRIQVTRDGPSGDKRTSLQRVRKDGSGFLAGAQDVESIPLMNGDPYIRGMGDISNVDVVLVGVRNGTQDPSISVCRDAGDASGSGLVNNATRTYTAVSLSHTASYNGSGLSAWTGTVDLSADGATEKGVLGYRIQIAGNDGDAATTKIYYIALRATTVSDIDLTEGTVAAYDNGGEIASLRGGAVGDEQDFFEGDFLGMRRHEAVERLRATTESDAAANPSPHWDFHIDGSLDYHFVERRGSDLTREYSIAQENLVTRPRHEFWAEEVAYQTIAYGAGSGSARFRIVNKTDFSAGGLYDSDRDPTGSPTEVELSNVARIMEFVDTEETSIVALNRKARAFHKLHRNTIEKFSVEVKAEAIRFFQTGDGIALKDIPTRTNDTVRVVGLTRKGSGGQEEQVSVTLGEPSIDIRGVVGGTKAREESLNLRSPQQGTTSGLSGSGTYFDTDHFGVYKFGIQDGRNIERVLLKLSTAPWQATAKAAAAEEITETDLGSSSSTQTVTTFKDFDFTVPNGGNSGYIIYVRAVPDTATTSFSMAVKNNTTARTYYNNVTNGGTFSSEAESFTTLENIGGDTLRVTIVTGATDDYEVTVEFFGINSHTHPLDFGIYQFDGDTGDGTGNPVYGSGITFAVDPTLAATGIPSTFATEKHPTSFGIFSGPQEVEVDVTGYMNVDATSGTIANGEHAIFFKGAADAGNDNADGLAVVSVTPIIQYRGGDP